MKTYIVIETNGAIRAECGSLRQAQLLAYVGGRSFASGERPRIVRAADGKEFPIPRRMLVPAAWAEQHCRITSNSLGA